MSTEQSGAPFNFHTIGIKLQCAAHLGGPRKAAVVAGATRVDRARAIMRADHCGGFERARSQRPFTSVRPDGRLEDSRD